MLPDAAPKPQVSERSVDMKPRRGPPPPIWQCRAVLHTTMTTNPQQSTGNPLLNLLDLVPSPLLLFSPDGRVAFTNRAAKTMACRPALSLPGDPNVRQMVSVIAKNGVLMNRDLEVEVNSDEGIETLRCECAPKPIAGLVAMAVSLAPKAKQADQNGSADKASGDDRPERLTLQQIMQLLKDDLMVPISSALEASVKSQAAPTPEWQSRISGLKEKLERTADMINVFGEDVLIGEDRMLMPKLVREICTQLAPQAAERNARFIIEGEKDDLPPVYGSEKLIRRALRECLQNALDHARTAVDKSDVASAVHIAFRASGQHLLISVRNLGALSSAAFDKHSATLFRPQAVTGIAPDQASDKEVLRIGLPLTQRILQLHGGRLRVEEAEDEVDVRLELPTGAPFRNTQHLDLLQAQIYAEDLSRLMARSRKRSNA